MVQKIVSFGFRHGNLPVSGMGVLVLDVRKVLRNPHHNRLLRKLTGLHPAVQIEIDETPDFAGIYDRIKSQAKLAGVEELWIGCTGGHHRSVYVSQKLADDMGVPVEHRDLQKP